MSLNLTAPDISHGIPIGVDDWRFAVEMVAPEDGSALWGGALWNTDEWAEVSWIDLTPSVRAVNWTRGTTSEVSRAEVGVLNFTLDNRDFSFSPWNISVGTYQQSYFAPGSLVRVVVFDGSQWFPQFTGIVERWAENVVEQGVESFVEVTAAETVTLLGRINLTAGPAVGANEYPSARLTRVLESAQWQYGFDDSLAVYDVDAYPLALLATTLAGSRLEECYKVADSCFQTFRSSRTGEAFYRPLPRVRQVNWVLETWQEDAGVMGPLFDKGKALAPYADTLASGVRWVPYVSVETTNDDINIVNVVELSPADGVLETYENEESIGRYGRRTLSRTDLLTAQWRMPFFAEDQLSRYAGNTYRIQSVVIDGSVHEDCIRYLIETDIDDVHNTIAKFGTKWIDTATYVIGYDHTVVPLRTGDGVQWTSRVSLFTTDVVVGIDPPETDYIFSD